jgi:hypothetical protein
METMRATASNGFHSGPSLLWAAHIVTHDAVDRAMRDDIARASIVRISRPTVCITV